MHGRTCFTASSDERLNIPALPAVNRSSFACLDSRRGCAARAKKHNRRQVSGANCMLMRRQRATTKRKASCAAPAAAVCPSFRRADAGRTRLNYQRSRSRRAVGLILSVTGASRATAACHRSDPGGLTLEAYIRRGSGIFDSRDIFGVCLQACTDSLNAYAGKSTYK
jgi:hypothetical protein